MQCRYCRGELNRPVLDLGSAPPSNAYLTAAALRAPEIWYPLRLLVCESCWLVQTEDHAGREELFDPDYAYFSSYSDTWLAHASSFVADAVARFELGAASLVAEVAANDGYLLQYVRQAGVPCYGIEPTAGTAAAARARGLDVVESFFGRALARALADAGRHADLIVANNVLAHVPDINDFVAGFACLLKPGGVATFEFPHLVQMLKHCQFDTVYHEHHSYLSLLAVDRIFRAHGLTIFDVQCLSTHGGSLRVFAQRSDAGRNPVTVAVAQLLDEERSLGVDTPGYYAQFQTRSEKIRRDLLRFLLDARERGEQVAAYGAAAKGNTLLNFSGVRPDLLGFVVDRNPAKQGKFLPGSRIPVFDEAALAAHRPPLILILPWNLKTELVAQLAYARQWGARFVTAVPHLEVLG